MSEHCRRRVVPSVFLGRHVVEAHSKILHFSKLELPYSCFISVRGESGSNIILVVQLTSEGELIHACEEGPNQLLVYEMGETFGGYWGPIPDTLMRRQWSATNAYVLKATPQKKKTTMSSTTTTVTEVTETTSSMSPVLRKETQDYIRVEIPLVNVSGSVAANDLQRPFSFDIDEAFDLLYDVTPHPNEKYDTGILPLVQFSARKQKSGRRKGEERYDLEIDADLPTEDPILTFPPYTENYTNEMKITSSHIHERKPINNRSSIRPAKDKPIFYERFFNRLPLKSTLSTVKKDLHESITNNFAKHTELKNDIYTHTESVQSWKEIEEFLKMFNDSNAEIVKPYNENMNLSNLLLAIPNKNFNYSAYLIDDLKSLNNFSKGYPTYIPAISNFGTFTRKPLAHYTYTTRNIRQFLKTASNERTKKENSLATKASIKESNLKSIEDIKKAFESYQKAISPADDVLQNTGIDSVTDHHFLGLKNTDATEVNKEQVTNYKLLNEKVPSPVSAPVTGSLVGHESWENLVQAAPVMAVLLNQTGNNDTVARKKRTIRPIAIENARPHYQPTKNTNIVTTTISDFGVSDMQEFAQLVELQDDELHERVALRYLRQYVGPVLFNICETEPKIRHIFLFNSSRIIISLANFTLQRMTVVLTPAHTLLSSTAKCVSSSLECQVAGTRVCIDTMNACDGVPNCGSYDVFDEDRLMCGAAVGLQHNVYLAAVTFLAVLLTFLYTVHYWLKRCVPKVSEAFFLYTDRAENILYLESIMRSPYDVDDESNRVVYHGNLFDDDDTLYADTPGRHHRNVLVRAFQRCVALITCKYRNKLRNRSEEEIGGEFYQPKKMYSFAELEMRRMSKCEGVDASVQTGSSLEIKPVSKITKTKAPKRLSTETTDYEPDQRVSKISDDDIQTYVNELNMLKFLKKSRTDSSPSSSSSPALLSILSLRGSRTEEEIKSHIYDPLISVPLTPVDVMSSNVHTDRSGPSKLQNKRLRFEEETVMIPTSDNEDDEECQPTLLPKTRQKTKGLDTIDEGEPSSGARDFKRFWGGGKAKKAKKKAHTTLR